MSDRSASKPPASARDHHAQDHTPAAAPASEPSPPPPADAELVAEMARGSIPAARELYRRLSPLVFSLACRVTGLQEDAEEVLLDTFQQAWVQADQYDLARASVTGWILSIARSRAIDKARARRRWRQHKQLMAESISSFPSSPPINPETEAIRSEERTRLQQVIDALPPDQRRVVELAYFSGLSHSQIAESLGEPLGTVKTRLRMAMKKIRSALAGVEGMGR